MAPPAELDNSWSSDTNPFAQPPKELPRVRKAYERVPQKAQSTHGKTRTVWKRPQNATLERKNETAEQEEGQSETRGVKRQCLNQVPAVAVMVPGRGQPQGYVSTMIEKVLGTPKRKAAPRQSLRQGLLEGFLNTFSPQKMLASAGLIAARTEEEESAPVTAAQDNFIDMLGIGTDVAEPSSEVEQKFDQVEEDTVNIEVKDTITMVTDSTQPIVEDAVQSAEGEIKDTTANDEKASHSPRKTPRKTPRKSPQKAKVLKASEKVVTPSRQTPKRGRPSKAKPLSEVLAVEETTDSSKSHSNMIVEVRVTHMDPSPFKLSPTKKSSPIKSPVKASPRKQSPRKQDPKQGILENDFPENQSPEKRTPKKRSPRKQVVEKQTLERLSPEKEIPKESQEESPIKNREALAAAIGLNPEINADETLEFDENMTMDLSAMSADSGDDASNEISSESSLSEADETITVDEETITMDADPLDNTYKIEDMTLTGTLAGVIGQISSPQLSRNREIDPQQLEPQQADSQSSGSADDTQGAADEDDILSSQPADDEKPKREKYFSRFSDDTLMLKDFLSRAQAARAARAAELDSPMYTSTSPRRSPRKVLGNLDSNSPSPSKPKEPEMEGGTPPGKPSLNLFDADEADEITAGPVSNRRSGRSRLPAPSRTVVGAPNFIPLRRADGEPILLQKTPAQELAITTRTNTRRNKGQAKMPKEILEALNVEWKASEDDPLKKKVGKAGKTVGWDKTLVYYQDETGAKKKKTEKKVRIEKTKEPEIDKQEEKKEEKAPTAVRKVKRLGALNGTPAPKPKKVAAESVTIATPTTRRRGRAAQP